MVISLAGAGVFRGAGRQILGGAMRVESPNLREMGARVEELLGEIRAADPGVAGRAEEVVGLLVDLYGEALAHVVDLVGAAGDGLMDQMVDDSLLASLLLLHGLHPEPVEPRIERALDRIRPGLGGKKLEVARLEDDGALRLRLSSPLDGCPSTIGTVQQTIEDAVTEWAPEVTSVYIEGLFMPVPVVAEPVPVPVTIGRRPPRETIAVSEAG
jgi:Fe-S cluster biogenesis protein NfuA